MAAAFQAAGRGFESPRDATRPEQLFFQASENIRQQYGLLLPNNKKYCCGIQPGGDERSGNTGNIYRVEGRRENPGKILVSITRCDNMT